ncbi:MAG: zinc ribbon domain-containing protein [Bacteroidales bacterium]|nr:zinc ribbon domain-containing protein [Bacteroidales bacterium]
MEIEIDLSSVEAQVMTGRYTSLATALGAAMNYCGVWKLKDKDKKLNALEVMSFMGKFDEEHPIPEDDPSFFRVSAEGAIGICPGVEYMTDWLLIPAMDEESVKKFEEDVKKLQALVEAKQAPAPEIPVVKAKFCPNCGTPYRNDAVKFCANCGTPRQ